MTRIMFALTASSLLMFTWAEDAPKDVLIPKKDVTSQEPATSEPKEKTAADAKDKSVSSYTGGCWVCSPHAHYAVNPADVEKLTKSHKCTSWKYLSQKAMKQDELEKFLRALNEQKAANR